jgi:glycosyltransferase involved in cell wall biosynthesis
LRALIVLSQPPLPEGGAPGKCAIGLIEGLRANGVDVRAVAARQHFAASGDPPDDLPVDVVPVPPELPGWQGRLRRVRRPYGHLAAGEFLDHVRRAAREVDVVHLEETETAWCDLGVAAPSLVHLHYLVRRDRSLGRPWQKRFGDVLEVRLGERAAVRRHRYLVASSPPIAAALRKQARHADVVHAPLSLAPRFYEPASLDGPPTAGLIGTAAWEPTARAMRRLVRGVWPRIHSRVPEARLLVAGRGVDALGLTAERGVELVGEVPSAADFLSRLSVLVYPLDHGSGMKVKVLESIASGVPVVTTEAGAEGIDAAGGVMIESEDAALAGRTSEILTDADSRRERGAQARAMFMHRYSPEPATRPLVELYQRMIH